MLDLTDKKRWQVKLPNGHILNVAMPTVKRSKQLQDTLFYLGGNAVEVDKENALYTLLLAIFNDNTDSLVFSREDVENMLQPKHLNMILQDYMAYVIELKKK